MCSEHGRCVCCVATLQNLQNGRHQQHTITRWDSNIQYRKKGETQYQKNPIPTQEFKSKPKAFTKSGFIANNIACWCERNWVELYFGWENIPFISKIVNQRSHGRWILLFFLVLETALWMAQYTGKTWTVLYTDLVRNCPWFLVLPVTVHWLQLVPLGKNPHSDSACSRTCLQSLGG